VSFSRSTLTIEEFANRDISQSAGFKLMAWAICEAIKAHDRSKPRADPEYAPIWLS